MKYILCTAPCVALLLLGAFTTDANAQRQFAGTYSGNASATILGTPLQFPFSVQVSRNGRLEGIIQVPRLLRLVTATATVDNTGRFSGIIRTQLGISGTFAGRIVGDNINARGTLNGISGGPVPFTARGSKVTDQSSGFAGTYEAEGPRTQRFPQVRVFVTPYNVATLEFLDRDGEVKITDNVNLGRNGSFASVKDGFFYSGDIDPNGNINGRYNGNSQGNGTFTGRRTSRRGAERSPAGSYVATSDDSRQAFVKLTFTVSPDLTVVGRFVQRSGNEVRFTALLGFQNRIVSTAEGGVNYFITVGANGDFTAVYNSRQFGNGEFAGGER